MSTFAPDHPIGIVGVQCTESQIAVTLSDGRTLVLPLAWYPRLEAASALQRSRWKLIGPGEGVRWEELDEDLSLEGFLAGRRAPGGDGAPSPSRRTLVALEPDLALKFPSGRSVNQALRDYLRLKQSSA